MNLFQNKSRQGLSVKKPTLKQRRTIRQTRTILAALCAGFAVFFALQSISGSVATKSAVAVTHAIKRGQTIHTTDLQTVHISDTPGLANTFASKDDVNGLIAQVDMDSGSIVCRPMTRASPVIKPGLTVIDVKVTGATTALIPGDNVSLVGSAGCDTMSNTPAQESSASRQPGAVSMSSSSGYYSEEGSIEQRQQPPLNVGNNDSDTERIVSTNQSDGRTCVLAEQATVTSSTHRDESGIAITQLAMPPQDAARIMAVQERMPIMAAKL